MGRRMKRWREKSDWTGLSDWMSECRNRCLTDYQKMTAIFICRWLIKDWNCATSQDQTKLCFFNDLPERKSGQFCIIWMWQKCYQFETNNRWMNFFYLHALRCLLYLYHFKNVIYQLSFSNWFVEFFNLCLGEPLLIIS